MPSPLRNKSTVNFSGRAEMLCPVHLVRDAPGAEWGHGPLVLV